MAGKIDGLVWLSESARRVLLMYLLHDTKKNYARIMAKGGEFDDLTRELQAAHHPA